MSDHAEDLIRLLNDSAISRTLQKAVFSSPRKKNIEIERVNVRPVEVKGQWMLQFSSQTATQQLHQNYSESEAAAELVRLTKEDFRNARLTTIDAVYEGRMSRKGKFFLRKEDRKESAEQSPVQPSAVSHNRTKNYLIPEGVPCPFLIHTGVMTKDGAVRASHSKKFGQINRFLEFINDVIDLLPTDRQIRVVDFGCGKSYLTFATHYLLTEVLKRDCEIIGLDRRNDVVQTCSRIAADLQLSNLTFSVGDIAGFESSAAIDMVISLHACDTATDEALTQAVRWNAPVVLAVPCCQHELNEILTSTALPPLTNYGLARERFASLATDTMRAALMNAAGYQTQILEFIDMEHTPKNILLRSVRRNDRTAEDVAQKSLAEVTSLRAQLGVPPLTLERRLLEINALPDSSPGNLSSGVPSADSTSKLTEGIAERSGIES